MVDEESGVDVCRVQCRSSTFKETALECKVSPSINPFTASPDVLYLPSTLRVASAICT